MTQTKRFITMLFLAVCFILTACDQRSETVKSADALIESIGEVSLDSGDAIAQAEEAVAALTEEDQAQLRNLQVLQDAEEMYRVLKDADAIEKK